jgi:DtxR family transcriptional regulator, Mn-dependent transcriptional regulator
VSSRKPTATEEDYLRRIWKSSEWPDGAITTSDLAASLGTAASSVSGNLARMATKGLIEHDPYGPIHLTEEGRAIALRMVRRHRIIETYLVEHFEYTWDEVDDEAEHMEHTISDRLIRLMDDELGHPTHDPHGDAIPREDGTLPVVDGKRLTDVEPDVAATVIRVSDHDPELLRYLDQKGVTPGVVIRMIVHREFADTVELSTTEGSSFEISAVVANSVWVSV